MKNNLLRFLKTISSVGFLGFALSVSAQITPCKIFQSGMVLQRDVVVPIWGTASANAEITVACNGKEASATADSEGKWKVNFPATTYGGPYEMTITSSAEGELAKSFTDVYFGEVFYCSGQSNMELEVQSCDDFDAVKAAANDETIRQMKISKGTSYELTDELPSVSWKPATSANVGSFSAAAYFCVLELKKLDEFKNIPFGILNVSYGGARVEAWMSKAMLGYDAYDITLAQGEKERQPTLIYNKMVNPIIGIPFKAMLWYQAESNCDSENDAKVYSEQFNNMIQTYRELWNSDFPVVWVQLPNYKSENRSEVNNRETNSLSSDAWITMRNEQTKSLSVLPKSAEIVTIDAGLAGNIHPTDKQTIGTRLALAVRKLVYGDESAAYCPQYKRHTLNPDGSVTIEFDNVGDGLVAKDSTNNLLKWFQIADASGKSAKATATLDGNTVTISKGDFDIATVYYAWNRCPGEMNLYSKVEDVYLPAGPFKFDVQPSEFGIKSFTTTKGNGSLTAEGGTFVIFTWQTGGDVTAYLNDVQVDPNTSAKIMLNETKDYVLKIVDNNNDENVETATIHFDVVPAKPTIKLSSKSGVLANPNDEMEILSNATAPGGFNVTKVEFYLNNELLETVTKAPFSYKWTAPSTAGDYTFYGIVYNDNDDAQYNSAKSENLVLTVTTKSKTRFEAEKADLKGGNGCTIKTDEFCSGEKYYDLQIFKQLIFKGIIAPEDGDYQLCIAYMTNYSEEGEIKEQVLYANAKSLGSIEFSSKDWAIYKTVIPLKKGENTVTILNSWGWMSFDYIEILGVTNSQTAVPDVQGEKTSMSAYCDTQSAVVVQYTTEAPKVSFELFDTNGKKIFQSGSVDASGKYTFGQTVQNGVYVVKMYAGNEVVVRQVIVK
ncbi:MAG: T9SS type A sorting domain-containing protein [Bacteroidales bacterium]|nr:T9SS type A sorting domain-containing protein [Bacteroidales bacterium]